MLIDVVYYSIIVLYYCFLIPGQCGQSVKRSASPFQEAEAANANPECLKLPATALSLHLKRAVI